MTQPVSPHPNGNPLTIVELGRDVGANSRMDQVLEDSEATREMERHLVLPTLEDRNHNVALPRSGTRLNKSS